MPGVAQRTGATVYYVELFPPVPGGPRGCGVCGANAHAAVLCPSFYRTDVVYNPTRRDRVLARLRTCWINLLARGVERRAAGFEAP
ncbi:hypothetical protein ACIHDR_41195 [Nocardia sp. NPDC052278]|uniref:hypothetical protein n=1 Tax=unclassified Nocardia TaxID=2637762 RepID=UPI0036AA6902